MRVDTVSIGPGDQQVELIIEGDGPDVLLYHHGTPAAGRVTASLLAAAESNGFQVVQVVRPGYSTSTRQPGRSIADVAGLVRHALVHARGRDDVLFATLGWSGGGPHALATAALAPSCASAASFAGVGPFDAADLDFLAGMGEDNIEEFAAAATGVGELDAFMAAAAPALATVTAADITAALESLLPPADTAYLDGGYAEEFAATVRYSLTSGAWGWFDDDIAFVNSWGFDLAEISAPVHVWQGSDDLMVPFSHGRWLASHIPTAVPHLVDGAGHLSLAAQFDDVISLLRVDLDAARV